jgi:hypothetical protein
MVYSRFSVSKISMSIKAPPFILYCISTMGVISIEVGENFIGIPSVNPQTVYPPPAGCREILGNIADLLAVVKFLGVVGDDVVPVIVITPEEVEPDTEVGRSDHISGSYSAIVMLLIFPPTIRGVNPLVLL